MHRRHGEARRRAENGNVLSLRFTIERLERLFLPRAELFLDGTATGLIVFALEDRRQRVTQLIDRSNHVLRQLAATARGQLQGARPVRIVEVVHVDPVSRRRTLRGLL